MTEQDWCQGTDVGAMLAFVEEKATQRQQRLFITACCRLFWRRMDDPQTRKAIELVERSADDSLSSEEWTQVSQVAWVAFQEIASEVNFSAGILQNAMVFFQLRRPVLQNLHGVRWVLGELAGAPSVRYDARAAAGLIRDLAGNPFRPTRDVDPEWLAWNEGTIPTLAEAVYERRLMPSGEFDGDRLLVLADALEDVGADEELIAHLRSPGPHYRGCFVVDALLAKS